MGDFGDNMSLNTGTATLSDAFDSDRNVDLAASLANAEGLGYAKMGPDMIINYVSPELNTIMGAERDTDLLGLRLDQVLTSIGLKNSENNGELTGGDLSAFIGKRQIDGETRPTTFMATTLDGRHVRVNTLYGDNGELLTTVRDV